MLAGGEIAAPLGTIFKHDRNVRVLVGEVRGFDLASPDRSAPQGAFR